LAIGIVVDDAIVVVENVERNIEAGLSPYATVRPCAKSQGRSSRLPRALRRVCAIFVPGLTGQFYKQFAVTIAISTLISAFNC
jgi:multidrug efflux pump subunit AcrB